MPLPALGRSERLAFETILQETIDGKRPDVEMLLSDAGWIKADRVLQRDIVAHAAKLGRARLIEFEQFCPGISNGLATKAKRYNLWALINYLYSRAIKMGRPSDIEEVQEYRAEKTRLTAVQADIAELDRGERQMELISRERADAEKCAMALEIKTNIFGQIPKLVAVLKGQKWTATDLRKLLMRHYQWLLERMQHGKVLVPEDVAADFEKLMARVIES